MPMEPHRRWSIITPEGTQARFRYPRRHSGTIPLLLEALRHDPATLGGVHGTVSLFGLQLGLR